MIFARSQFDGLTAQDRQVVVRVLEDAHKEIDRDAARIVGIGG